MPAPWRRDLVEARPEADKRRQPIRIAPVVRLAAERRLPVKEMNPWKN